MTASHRCNHCYQRTSGIGVSDHIMRVLHHSDVPIGSVALYNLLVQEGVETTKVSVSQTCRNLAAVGDIEKMAIGGGGFGWIACYPDTPSPLANLGIGVPDNETMRASMAQVSERMPTTQALDELMHSLRPAIWSGRVTDPEDLADWVQRATNVSRPTVDLFVDMMIRKNVILVSADWKRLDVPQAYRETMDRALLQVASMEEVVGHPWRLETIAQFFERQGISSIDANELAIYHTTHRESGDES